MSGHTPGPWHYGAYLITSEPGNVITGSRNYPMKVEDGHLIAAAPDLLEALRYAEKGLALANAQALEELRKLDPPEDESIFQAPLNAVRAAIAKAEGQAE